MNRLTTNAWFSLLILISIPAAVAGGSSSGGGHEFCESSLCKQTAQISVFGFADCLESVGYSNEVVQCVAHSVLNKPWDSQCAEIETKCLTSVKVVPHFSKRSF
ncbi:MAG: hypothetical protein JST04_05035 [Bdellovibrionales bacterium]|nr:hypothetical protein [Bdellovibrionales bacterium]